VVAQEIWRNLDNRGLLRKRWDKALNTLRRKFRDAHVRPNLIRTSGGVCELLLLPGDTLEVEV
jgi:hypothetical protein